MRLPFCLCQHWPLACPAMHRRTARHAAPCLGGLAGNLATAALMRTHARTRGRGKPQPPVPHASKQPRTRPRRCAGGAPWPPEQRCRPLPKRWLPAWAVRRAPRPDGTPLPGLVPAAPQGSAAGARVRWRRDGTSQGLPRPQRSRRPPLPRRRTTQPARPGGRRWPLGPRPDGRAEAAEAPQRARGHCRRACSPSGPHVPAAACASSARPGSRRGRGAARGRLA
mmetsp:Transcript_112128/g.362042  ORF Transcript_112128/g.362042 Transcript_112128/m.362042 type:complete len:224 (-) Transcript_112128:327-998(-)